MPRPRPYESIILGAVLETLPLLLGVVALAVTVVLSPTRMDDDFLNAAVQIIPFLLLALALETRLLAVNSPSGPQPEAASRVDQLLVSMIRLNRKLAAVFAVVLLVAAETAGLVALNDRSPDAWLGPWLLGAVVSGMVTVGVAALVPRR